MPKGTGIIGDASAMNAIQAKLDGQEWSADTLDDIAAIVRASGRAIREPFDHDTEGN